jgi:serine/threonine-protein kinase
LASVANQQRIGRYAIIRQLGQGGMADVFLARSEGEAGFGKLVAFKVLQPLFAAQPIAVNLFLDEARLVSGLDHPNIVQTHDLGRAGDRYFIAMEYVDGMDLARLATAFHERGERIPLPFALAILCRICDGLHAAHMATGPDGQPLYLVHRDVKSANVFLSRTGAVKIGDFGIAKATHTVRMSRTELGQVKGTPGSMPPEQRLGMDVDLRADVYGVGAIAYEILSGEPVNLDYVALAAQGTTGWPHLPPLSASRADVPKALDAIIFKALAFAREARFPGCAALEQELHALAATAGLANDKEIGAWVRSELDRETSARQRSPHIQTDIL